MSQRAIVILSCVCTLALTLGAWWQVMIYKHPPHENLALWLPFIVLLRAHDAIFPVFISLFQFPALAAIFVFVSRHQHPLQVLAILIIAYTFCVWAALAMLKAGLWT